jgi:hypothetical protein
MNRLIGELWVERKKNIAIENANKSIQKIKEEKHSMTLSEG